MMSFADYMKEFGEVVGDKDDNKCCGEEGARHSHTVTKTRKGKLIKYCKRCQKECLFKKDRVDRLETTEKKEIKCVVVGDGQQGKSYLTLQFEKN